MFHHKQIDIGVYPYMSYLCLTLKTTSAADNMSYFFKFLLVAALLIPTLNSNAQTPTKGDRSLLWRISGNGLTKPSYLFGTIHLMDKRLFRHDDSVFVAIERTEGIALEVNLNDLVAYYINRLLDERENDKKLSDLMDEEQLKKYEPYFKKKFGKRSEEVTTKDIVKEKNKWLSKYQSEGSMPTFLDAYLYTIADKMGKWTGGIEDIEDQMSLIDRTDLNLMTVSDNKTNIEDLIKLYINEDIQGMENLINKYDQSFKDALLLKRNVKMARRMDSLSRFRSMFFAVGAAHLPGEEGVISLLRKRGFVVEPVHSDKRIDADQYPFKFTVGEKWVEVTDKKGFYSMQMPGSPTPIDLYGLFELQFLADFSTNTGFMALVIPGGVGGRSLEDLTDEYAKNVFGHAPETKTKIKSGNIDGYEITGNASVTNMRIRVFSYSTNMYVLASNSSKETDLRSEKVEKFLASFKINENRRSVVSSHEIVDSLLAYKITSPAKLELNERLTKKAALDPTWRTKTYMGMDESTGAVVMLISKDATSGSYIDSDSALLNELFDVMAENSKEATKKDTMIHGYNAMMMLCRGEDGADTKIMSIVRENRNLTFALVAEPQHMNDPRLNVIFNTLEILPYKEATWQTRSNESSTFSSYVPAPFEKGEEEDIDAIYYSDDTFSGISYTIFIDTLSKYTWADNDSLFIKEKQSEYVNDPTQILSIRPVANINEQSREIIFKHTGTLSYWRMKSIYHNNILYHVCCIGDMNTIKSKNTDRYFSEFKINGGSTYDLHKNRSGILLQDLRSKDSATISTAVPAIRDMNFSTKDLPVLHEMLLDTFTNMDAFQRAMAAYNVRSKLSEIRDPSTSKFIRDNYGKFKDNEEHRYRLLATLSAIETPESYKTLVELLAQIPLSRENASYLAFNIDSVELMKPLYGELVKMIPDTNTGSLAVNIMNEMLDSGLISMNEIKANEQPITTLADGLFSAEREEDTWRLTDISLIHLLDTLNSPASIDILKKYTGVKSIYFRKRAAMVLAKKNVDITANVWNDIAANLDTRSSLYDELKEIHKEALFPKEYATQKALSESEIYVVANEDEEPTAIKLIGERTSTLKGTRYRFYLYDITYGEGEGTYHYMGVAGGYDMNSKQLSLPEDLTTICNEDEYTKEKEDELFEEYLKMVAEYQQNSIAD